jgi:small glutamine-rich tetratricopeptide repeat-containing protein alpha
MVEQAKKQVAVGIIDFLNACIKDGTFSLEDKESAEVAIDCVSGLFDVSQKDKEALLGNDTLVSLLANKGKKAVAIPASDDATSRVSQLSDEQKKEAEKIKLEGNRYMAQQKFQEAVDAYSRALDIDANNAIYLSNRSAAFSSLRESAKAAADATKAIEIDPSYSKAYSRLGLALYSQGDAQGALKAYEKGLEAEGDNPSDGMKRGYETAKKRAQEELDVQVPGADDATETRAESAPPPSSGGGLGGLANMFGGGGMPDLGSLLNNPQIAQMAQNLMSNPDALNSIMNNPQLRQMQESMRGGQMPNMGDLMNNPALQDMARNFMGGNQADRPAEEE